MGQNPVCVAKKAQALALLELVHSVAEIHIHMGLGIQTIYDIRGKPVK
jgi:hypothetical protein